MGLAISADMHPATSRTLGALLLVLTAVPSAALAQPKLDGALELAPPPPPSYTEVDVAVYASTPGAPAAPSALAAPGAPLEDRATSGSRVGRISAELALGAAGMFGGGLAGFAIGAAACDSSATDAEWFPCLGPMAIGGAIGAVAGTPLAIWLGGTALDGNGGFGWTLLGSSAGFLAWAAVAAAAEGDMGAWLGLALPLVGGVLGFELTSDSSARAANAARERTHLSAGLAPRRGGATVSLTGNF